MTLKALARSIDEVAAHLPFSVEDYDRANEAFQRWRVHRRQRDRNVVELWLYCYTRRYFLVKFIQMPKLDPGGFERPVAEAFDRARRAFKTVEEPDRFASFVSVVCKNTFINYYRKESRSPRVYSNGDQEERIAAELDDPLQAYDGLVLRHTVERALDRLPESLREVARLRLLEERTYEEIEEITGRSRPTLRSYFHKAIARLRKDSSLKDFVDRWTGDE